MVAIESPKTAIITPPNWESTDLPAVTTTAFKRELTRLSPNGSHVFEGGYGFEAFYRFRGQFVQVVRRSSVAGAHEAYVDRWQEVLFHEPIPGIGHPTSTRYFWGRSFAHVERSNGTSGGAIEHSNQLLVGSKDILGKTEEDIDEEAENLSPKYSIDGFSVERAGPDIPDFKDLSDYFLKKRLVLIPGTGLAHVLFPPNRDNQEAYPLMKTKLSTTLKLLVMLRKIRPWTHEIKEQGLAG